MVGPLTERKDLSVVNVKRFCFEALVLRRRSDTLLTLMGGCEDLVELRATTEVGQEGVFQ